MLILKVPLRRNLGPNGFVELEEAVEEGEAVYSKWRGGEPRVWGRTVRFVYRMLNIRADFALARRGMAGAQQRSALYMEQGVQRWHSEGRITDEQVQDIKTSLANPNVRIAMEHFGALMLISVVFRFPVGSIIRVLWVLIFMVRASDAAVRQRKNSNGGLRVHNPVVLLVSAIPGVGAIAYIFSGPLMKPLLMRLAIDETMHEMPWGMYLKLGFNKWLPPKALRLSAPR